MIKQCECGDGKYLDLKAGVWSPCGNFMWRFETDDLWYPATNKIVKKDSGKRLSDYIGM